MKTARSAQSQRDARNSFIESSVPNLPSPPALELIMYNTVECTYMVTTCEAGGVCNRMQLRYNHRIMHMNGMDMDMLWCSQRFGA